MFENKLLKRIFGPETKEAVAIWICLLGSCIICTGILLAKYCAVIILTRTRLAGHVARMVELPNACTILVSKLNWRDHWVTVRLYDSVWGPLAGCCEHGSMIAVPLSDHQLLKTDCTMKFFMICEENCPQ
jgi:hypothetical protein